MKTNRLTNRWPTRLAGVALLVLGTGTPLWAATSAALEPRVVIRPLTPQEKKDHAMAAHQVASGLNTVGVGQPAHLEALVNKAVPAADILGVTWTLTNAPIGSTAVLTETPLGTNIPTYKMSDQATAQLVGRTFLRPDVVGDYTVIATVQTTTGTTNLTRKITAARYMGAETCALCHSGGVIAQNTYAQWTNTGHATFFTRAIDGHASDHYAAYCISCHVVGYDTNTNSVNGGFDDVAKQLGWTFPAVLTNGNWAAMPAALKKVSNIQCENCHGPGSEHAMTLGDPSKISTTFATADCAQCHDSKPQHPRNAEWNMSRHAVAVKEERTDCAGCHGSAGFVDRMDGIPAEQRRVEYEAIGCSACHDPHSAANPHQLRMTDTVTLMDKTTITKGGTGKMCMSCHMTRREAKTYAETSAANNRFGPHYGAQADMLAGANAYTYGKTIPSSAHLDVVENSCATCHMQNVASTNAMFTKVGGHTFNLSYQDGTNKVQLTGACVECHGDIKTFDIPRQDYNGDGIVEGVQTEVKALLKKLAMMLPPIGQPTYTITTNYTRPQLKAVYNYQFVNNDGSYGIHNLAYAVGVLKASIADLTGDANNDSLPDSWQTQYFGSINHPDAAPSATPAGDGVPNWLKYSLGLDPKAAGAVMPDGVVWSNGKFVGGGPIDPADTNTVAIYTAAEVVFKTEAGKNYQIQAASSLSAGWQNIGQPIAGTGSQMSYVTPTREKTQNFYRVVAQ